MKGAATLEARGNSPSKEHPIVFSLASILGNDVEPSDKLEVFIEWHDGTYGSKVPVVVVRKP